MPTRPGPAQPSCTVGVEVFELLSGLCPIHEAVSHHDDDDLAPHLGSHFSAVHARSHDGGASSAGRRWDNTVLQAMSSVRFEAMGVTRTYLDFFMAFGWSLSVTMLMQSVLLWQLASLASTDAARVRPLIAVFALATAVSGIIAWRLIFPLPALVSAALAACLMLAFFVGR
jgi:hypothetical protein